MSFLRKQLDQLKPHFKKGGKWEKWYYVYEAIETFLYSPDRTTSGGVHIRDAADLKRMMATVIIAMMPCLLFGFWNVGHQHFLAIEKSADWIEKSLFGISQVLPIIIVSYVVGLGIEFIFSTLRRHPINEGFLVTGLLIPLVMPPDIPLWQVAVATAFAVIFAKEVFGGTGMNILNVALTARAFLYFAYPPNMSGEVWTIVEKNEAVAGYSGATPLAIATTSVTNGSNVVEKLNVFGQGWNEHVYSFKNMFIGIMPGSIGETSTLMCLIGAFILIATGIGSWKIMVSVFAGAYGMAWIINGIGLNPYMDLPAHYHIVMGGLAFGAVFMATDPVTAPQTELGKWFYGLLIGIFTILIRIFNPGYPEGIMMAILLMNVAAPLIDYFIVNANKKRRIKRASI